MTRPRFECHYCGELFTAMQDAAGLYERHGDLFFHQGELELWKAERGREPVWVGPFVPAPDYQDVQTHPRFECVTCKSAPWDCECGVWECQECELNPEDARWEGPQCTATGGLHAWQEITG